jgi:hypothetical protein
MTGTFISYRREDAAGYAGRLRESLERRLGAARVFRDVDTLRPGQDFVQAIDSRLAECRVMLAVIGREWVDARDHTGARRLDEPYDFVRLEIAAGLARPEVLVVPVLVEGASMPAAGELPENIRPLARRHAVSVRDETWDTDVDRLVTVIEGAGAAGAPPRPDAPVSGPRLWVAAGIAVLVVGLLLFTQSRGGRDRDSRDPVATSGSPAGNAPPAATTSTGSAIAPYTIDIPRVAEAAFDDLIYSVVSGNVSARGDANELRLRVRLMNFGRGNVNFWDNSFRLALGGEVLSPVSDLNDVIPGNSLRYGIVAFRIPPQTRTAALRIVRNNDTAEIPLDLSSTGRPPVDERAEIADSQAQAIVLPVVRDAAPLLAAGEVGATLLSVSSRRFANALRLIVSIRIVNDGRYPVHSGAVTLRVAAGGELLAPNQSPNEVIDPMSTISPTVVFDLPPTATSAVLRTMIAKESAERTLALR